MFQAFRSDPYYDKDREWGEGGGVPYNIPIAHSIHTRGVTQIKIRWRDDGYAVIETLEGIADAARVGNLTQEEPTAKSAPDGFQPMVEYTLKSMGQTFELFAMQIQEQKTIKIQICDVNITVPDSIARGKIDRGSIHFKPADEWKTGFSLDVNASWGRGPDPNAMYAVITGSGETADCFR